MIITCIIDNLKAINYSMKEKKGLSIYIQGNYSNVLFDFGVDENTLNNFKQLNLNPGDIDYFVLSHGHFDHGNGFLYFKDYIKNKVFISGKGVFDSKYFYKNGLYHYLGLNFSRKNLEAYNINYRQVDEIYKIDQEIYLIGNFKSTSKNEAFYLKRDHLVKDDFSDEIALIIENKTGLTLILGCSHPGILSIISRVEGIFNKKVSRIIVGPHLMDLTEDEIVLIKDRLKYIKNIHLSHCIGELGYSLFKNDPNLDYTPLRTGSSIVL